MIIYFLDVGQGDSIVIISPDGQVVLVDGGPYQVVTSRLDRVLPFWRRRIDIVMASHADDDHVSGLAEVVDRFNIEQVFMTPTTKRTPAYSAFLDRLAASSIPSQGFYRGQQIDIGGARLRSWWPPQIEAERRPAETNGLSEVVELQWNDFSLLLTGDIDRAGWQQIGQSDYKKKVSVLKAAHHGAANGLDEQAALWLKPVASVISVGKDNRYGHPSAETLGLLDSVGSSIYRTDQQGTIKVVVNGAGFSFYTDKNCILYLCLGM